MQVRDLDPDDIEFIHVDRTDGELVMPVPYTGSRAEFVAFMGHHEIERNGRLLTGERFRIGLKASAAISSVPLAIGA